MSEIARRWQALSPTQLKQVQEQLQKHASSDLVFGSRILVKSGNRELKGRFVQSHTDKDSVVQFADGQGIVPNGSISPVVAHVKMRDQYDFVLACADFPTASRLKESLWKHGFDALHIAQNELAVTASEEKEADLYELAYEEIPLEKVTKQPIDMELIEASQPFDLDQVDGDTLTFRELKAGDRSPREVVNRFTHEVLLKANDRLSEKDLAILQASPPNRLYRADDGSLITFSSDPYTHVSDPFLTREVLVSLRNSKVTPDDVISLKDGSTFLEKNTAVTDGILVASLSAGPLAFVGSYHDRYMGFNLKPELQFSYEITSVRKALSGDNAADFALRLTFVHNNEKFGFDMTTEGHAFVKSGVFDAVAFQVQMLSKMVRSGVDEGAAYRFVRTPQYQMLQSDLAQKVSDVLEKEVQMASLESPERSQWLSTTFVKSMQDMSTLGVDVTSRHEVVTWLGENKPHPTFSEDVLSFLKRTSDFEFDRLRELYF